MNGIAFSVDTVVFNANALAPGTEALREWAEFQNFKAGVVMAGQRGRMDITWKASRVPTIVNGVAGSSPVGVVGEYYLFDSTGFVLVHPDTRTFTAFRIIDDVFNTDGRRDGWPEYFEFVAPIIETATETMLRASRRDTVRLFWHADALPSRALARGRLTMLDVPLGELNVARWFGAARALANAVESTTALPSGRTTVTAAVPTAEFRLNGALPSILLKQELMGLRTARIPRRRLVLPADYRMKGGLGLDSAVVANHWRTAPRP